MSSEISKINKLIAKQNEIIRINNTEELLKEIAKAILKTNYLLEDIREEIGKCQK